MTESEAIKRLNELIIKKRNEVYTLGIDYPCDTTFDLEMYKQLVELLEELKFRRVLQLQCEKEFFAGYEKGKKEGYNKGYADGSLSVTSEIRNKVIDDFVNDLKDYFVIPHDVGVIEMKAEQLKAGENRE